MQLIPPPLLSVMGIPQRLMNVLGGLEELAVEEFETWRIADISLPVRLSLWRRGFMGASATLYGGVDKILKNKSYLNDASRYRRTGRINGEYRIILKDKLLFDLCLRQVTDRLVPIEAVIDDGSFIAMKKTLGEQRRMSTREGLAELTGKFVVKPRAGTGGGGVTVYENRAGQYSIGGQAAQMDNIIDHIGNAPHIVTPFIEQAEYSATINSSTANTIRILTMWDYERMVPFVAAAIHKFGTEKNSFADNFGGGALSCDIDSQTGVLGRSATFPDNRTCLEWWEQHPESGAQIKGVQIPGWETICAELLDIADAIPFLPYIGWDILCTASGFRILEGNYRSSVRVFQMHKPLLVDPRVRAFFRHHGIQ